MPKVAGIVILYNPSFEIFNNIKSYFSQVQRLYVFDNSEIINSSLIKELNKLHNVIIISENKNIGIASALNYGATRAIDEGFDYLLTMDQDSIAPHDLVEKMLHAIKNLNRVGVISPFHLSRFSKLESVQAELEEVYTMTSGNLLNLEAFQAVGKFCEDFFIDWVDIEYYWRLKLNAFKVIRVNTVKLTHNEGNITKHNFLFYRNVYTTNSPPTRLYYKTRNYLYLRKQYKNKLRDDIKFMDKFCLKYLFKILFYEKQKLEKFKMILKGLLDYKGNKTGKYST